jgi:MoaA/NifB/PqqE/SkfB family radical SAM enzyme
MAPRKKRVAYDGIGLFDLPPGFYVSGGDVMAAYDGYWEPGACQNRCVFCLEARFVPGSGAMLPAVPLRPRVDINSWEPTSLKDLPGTVRMLKKRYETVALFTNGRRLDAGLSRRLTAARVDEVVISLHGPDAATHDALTRAPGSFAEAVAGIQTLSVAAAGKRPKVGASLVLTRSNLPLLGATLDLAVSLGARMFSVSLMVPLGRAAKAVKTHGPGAKAAFNAFARLANARGGKTSVPVHLMHFPLCAAKGPGMKHLSVVLAPNRGSFAASLAPSWTERCSKCRDAACCEGMMADYARTV